MKSLPGLQLELMTSYILTSHQSSERICLNAMRESRTISCLFVRRRLAMDSIAIIVLAGGYVSIRLASKL
jgi:hypothetical protein